MAEGFGEGRCKYCDGEREKKEREREASPEASELELSSMSACSAHTA